MPTFELKIEYTMKKLLFTVLVVASFGLLAQDTTVLTHIEPELATEAHNYWGQTAQGVPLWGYYLGHNAWGDEAFGEQYEINGQEQVVGVMAMLSGTVSSSNTASYKVYTVANSGLPQSSIGSKSFVLNSVPVDSDPHMVMFDNPVSVTDRFFVVLDLGDYSHDPLDGDTLCLLSGPQGSRPASDDTFGRNAIRWHDHGGENWKDFFTQNFTPLSIYFGIYPIMDGVVTTGEIFADATQPMLYPVPARDVLNVSMHLKSQERMRVQLYNMNGKRIADEQHALVAGENQLQIQLAHLTPGNYIVLIESPNYRSASRFTKL